VRAWPSRVIIDPAGYIVGAASGEGNYEGFEQAIAAVIKVFDERGELDRRPLATAPESDGVAVHHAQVSGKSSGGRQSPLYQRLESSPDRRR
jgi:hypothetical protein